MFGSKVSIETADFSSAAALSRVGACLFSAGKISCALPAAMTSRLVSGSGQNQFMLSLAADTFTNGNESPDYITLKPGAKVQVACTC